MVVIVPVGVYEEAVTVADTVLNDISVTADFLFVGEAAVVLLYVAVVLMSTVAPVFPVSTEIVPAGVNVPVDVIEVADSATSAAEAVFVL